MPISRLLGMLSKMHIVHSVLDILAHMLPFIPVNLAHLCLQGVDII